MRRILPYTTALTVAVALYVGWILYSRYQNAAEAERELQQKRVEADRKVVAAYGGDQLKILSFGATKGEISPGEPVTMCYGVANAVHVTIEPGVEPIKPAVTHCLEISPEKTTTYTLQAEDAAGNSKSVSLTIRVR